MKVSIFIPYWCDDNEASVVDMPDIDSGDLIRTKREAIKAVVFLMAEWNIEANDFIETLRKLVELIPQEVKKKGGE